MERLTKWCEAEKCYVSNLRVDGINNSIVMRLEQLEKLGRIEDAAEQGDWISVKDRLPNEGRNVLVFIPYKKVNLHYVSYLESKKWYVPDRIGRFELHDVTHWKPLPASPKEARHAE